MRKAFRAFFSRLAARYRESQLAPWERFIVAIEQGEIVVRRPDRIVERVSLNNIEKIFVETNDSGPGGLDVWWIVQGRDSEWVAFPLGARGEESILEEFRWLPGFEVRGMNSVANRRFECWPNPE